MSSFFCWNRSLLRWSSLASINGIVRVKETEAAHICLSHSASLGGSLLCAFLGRKPTPKHSVEGKIKDYGIQVNIHAVCPWEINHLSDLIYEMTKTIANLLGSCKLKINAMEWGFVFPLKSYFEALTPMWWYWDVGPLKNNYV